MLLLLVLEGTPTSNWVLPVTTIQSPCAYAIQEGVGSVTLATRYLLLLKMYSTRVPRDFPRATS